MLSPSSLTLFHPSKVFNFLYHTVFPTTSATDNKVASVAEVIKTDPAEGLQHRGSPTVVTPPSPPVEAPRPFRADELSIFLKAKGRSGHIVTRQTLSGDQVELIVSKRRSSLVNAIIIAAAVVFSFVVVPLSLLSSRVKTFFFNTINYGTESSETKERVSFSEMFADVQVQKAGDNFCRATLALNKLNRSVFGPLLDRVEACKSDGGEVLEAAKEAYFQAYRTHSKAGKALVDRRREARATFKKFNRPIPTVVPPLLKVTPIQQQNKNELVGSLNESESTLK